MYVSIDLASAVPCRRIAFSIPPRGRCFIHAMTCEVRARSYMSCPRHRGSIVRAPLSLYVVWQQPARGRRPAAPSQPPSLRPIAPSCSHGGTQLLPLTDDLMCAKHICLIKIYFVVAPNAFLYNTGI